MDMIRPSQRRFLYSLSSGNSIVFFILLVLITAVILGCINAERKEILRIAGSTTLQPIISAAAEEYMKKHPDVFIYVQGGGSGTGIKMVSEGSVDIAMSSREIKEKEYKKTPELKKYEIALDGIAIVVNPDNPLDNLTKEQVRAIFSGKIRNFKDVGGDEREIVVVVRESGSGTRATFDELVMNGEEVTDNALQKPSNGAVKATIATNKNAIGYIGVGYVDESVKALRINDVEPTRENVRDGRYPISRKLYLITKGDADGIAKDFIEFMLSEEGQRIVEENGFVRIS